MTNAAIKLLRRTTCPHCWTSFPPEDILWIAAHTDLLGDPRLGPEQAQRFLPTRFDLGGNAIDARGFACNALACPQCHLPIPRGLLESEPTFLSILGTPACGKSFLLTAMTWELRRLLPQQFGLTFLDADPVLNRSLNDYEESLFLNAAQDELVPLANLIRKTEVQGGELYHTVMYGNQSVSYPRPFLFSVLPQEGHPSFARAGRVGRTLCLYDNAGEHYQIGQDSTSSPVTRHMARARALLFLFDPTQDPRFQRLCRQGTAEIASSRIRTSRQETVLHEAATRVRRVLGLSQNVKHNRPLLVVLTKLDVWADILEDHPAEPWKVRDGRAGLDIECIESRSSDLRTLLLQSCPELVVSAESFCEKVIYIAVSALGRTPVSAAGGQGPAIRPADIRPIWATVPMLYAMCRWMPGLIPVLRRTESRNGSARPADRPE